MPVQPAHIDSTSKITRIKKGKKKKPRKGNFVQGVDVADISFPGVSKDLEKTLRARLAEAAEDFEAERFRDADKLLSSIQKLSYGVAEVHELHGLVQYRLGKWRNAISDLSTFESLTGSIEQHPVIADSHRAMKNWNKTEELWQELGEASPGPELMEEGRIVQAGCLADQGKFQDAIRFLEKAPKPKGKPTIYHLRRLYYLASLYERAGDIPHARRAFRQVFNQEPKFADVAERLANLN